MPPLARVALAALAFVTIGSSVAVAVTPLSSAVLIYDRRTLVAAPEVVERVAELGDTRIMFVVTIHCQLTPELRPTRLGLMGDRYRPWEDPANFEPLTDELLDFYRARLTDAIRRAAERGMAVSLLLHFDPAGEVNEWRNHYDFDPLEDFGGYSYESALVDSCLEAVRRATPADAEVEFSLAGEMGRSVFAYPASYLTLLSKVNRGLGGRSLSVGVSLNHNDVAGGHRPTDQQRAETQRLLSACDFVGFSNYAPFSPPPSVEKFQNDCRRFEDAISELGLEIPAATPLHFSEIGLGGAPDKNGDASPARAAAEPWEGTVRPRRNPWRGDAMTTLRRRYHNALLGFLRHQPGPRPVEAAYFWSEGSWEPLGIHNPAFADETIRDAVRRHNASAR